MTALKTFQESSLPRRAISQQVLTLLRIRIMDKEGTVQKVMTKVKTALNSYDLVSSTLIKNNDTNQNSNILSF